MQKTFVKADEVLQNNTPVIKATQKGLPQTVPADNYTFSLKIFHLLWHEIESKR
jgi:hypothetical protein